MFTEQQQTLDKTGRSHLLLLMLYRSSVSHRAVHTTWSQAHVEISARRLAQQIMVGDIFKPPPPVGAGGGYMFPGRPSVPLSVRPCVRDSRGSFMFPRYLQYLLTDFRQTFVTGVLSWDTDDLITFLGQ